MQQWKRNLPYKEHDSWVKWTWGSPKSGKSKNPKYYLLKGLNLPIVDFWDFQSDGLPGVSGFILKLFPPATPTHDEELLQIVVTVCHSPSSVFSK